MSSSKVVINHEGVTRGHSGEGIEINSKLVTVNGKLMVAGMDVAETLQSLAAELKRLIDSQTQPAPTHEDKVQIPQEVQAEVAKEEVVEESADSSDKEKIMSEPVADEAPAPAKKTGKAAKTTKPAEPQAE